MFLSNLYIAGYDRITHIRIYTWPSSTATESCRFVADIKPCLNTDKFSGLGALEMVYLVYTVTLLWWQADRALTLRCHRCGRGEGGCLVNAGETSLGMRALEN